MKAWKDVEKALVAASANEQQISRMEKLYNEPEFQELMELGGDMSSQDVKSGQQAGEATDNTVSDNRPKGLNDLLSAHSSDLFTALDSSESLEPGDSSSDEVDSAVDSFDKAGSETQEQFKAFNYPVDIESLSEEEIANLPQEALDKLASSVSTRNSSSNIKYALTPVVQTGFPHRRVKGKQHFTRKNGRLTVTMTAPDDLGLPYGISARMIFVHICTQIVQSQSKTINFEKSFQAFLRDGLNVPVTRGVRGSLAVYKQSLISLLGTSITATEKFEDEKTAGFNLVAVRIASKASLWWDKEESDSSNIGGTIEVSDEFYEAVIKHAAPLSGHSLIELAKHNSPLAWDIYVWLAYRYYKMCKSNTKHVAISWEELHEQLGSGYEKLFHFKQAFKDALQHVKDVYPDARFSTGNKEAFVLFQSKPQIAPKDAIVQA